MKSRLMLLLALTIAPGISLAAEPAQVFPAPVYVTVENANAVEVFPQKTVWHGLNSAHYDALSPDGSRLLVSSHKTGDIYLVDTATGKKLATFNIGTIAQGVKIGPHGHWGLAIAPKKGAVAAIDLKKLKLVKMIKVGKVPHNASFSPDGKRAYVTLQGGTGVAVIDMKMLKKVDEIPVPGVHGPHNLDLADHGKIMWVRDAVGNVAVIDIKTHKELAVIKVGNGHAGIDVIPGGRYVFTGAIADHVVDVIDPKTYKVVKRIDVGQGPHGVRASRDGRWVYVAVTGTNKVAVIDTESLKVVRQIPTQGEVPFFVAVQGNH